MCANCVAQGAAYVGGAVGALQVMRARARHRRLGREASRLPEQPPSSPAPAPADPPPATPQPHATTG